MVIFATTCSSCVFIKIVKMSGLLLNDFSLFKGFNAAQVKQLTALFSPASYARNRLVFDQGGPADYLYLLAAGNVIIRYKPYDGPALVVATIEPGSVFGWSAVLGRLAYTSSALAVENSQVYRLAAEQLKTICATQPEMGSVLIERLAKVVNERQTSTQGEILNILQSSFDKNGSCSKRMNPND